MSLIMMFISSLCRVKVEMTTFIPKNFSTDFSTAHKQPTRKSEFLRFWRRAAAPPASVPNGVTVAESNGVKVYEGKNNGGTRGDTQKRAEKNPIGALNRFQLPNGAYPYNLFHHRTVFEKCDKNKHCVRRLLCCYSQYAL